MNKILARVGRRPLHAHIAVIFIFLTTGVGAILGWFNYHQNTRVILSAADRVFDQISRELQLDFQGAYRPVVSTVNLLALEERIVRASTLEERAASLPVFREALATQPHVSALQVGYANGDYFIVRPLKEVYMRQRFEAPENAALVVDNIEANEQGDRVQTRLYYDADLNRIAVRSLGPTEYDPRIRPWYTIVVGSACEVSTKPYLYYFIGKVGITVGRQSPDGRAVVASDITLEHLSQTLARHRISPSAETVLFDEEGRALAYRDVDRLVLKSEGVSPEMATLDGLGSPVLSALSERLLPAEMKLSFPFGNRAWRGSVRRIAVTDDVAFFMAVVAPEEELLVEAVHIRWQSVWVTALILIAALPLAWLLANRIARPLRKLTRETDRIRHFDFAGPVTTSSLILEISQLAESTGNMKNAIQKFLDLVSSVASERSFDNVLSQITEEAMRMSGADAAALYLVNDDDSALEPACTRMAGVTGSREMVILGSVPRNGNGELARSIQTGVTVTTTLTPGRHGDAEDAEGTLASLLGTDKIFLAAIPLRGRDGHSSGTLALVFDISPGKGDEAIEPARIAFIEAFSGFAVVSLESRRLLKMQKSLLDAFIKLMAGTIDAKSPYTGGHCQRVPVLTQMIAEAACDSDSSPFSDFSLDEEGWEALQIASWLHDYGKVTTPEYVVDKATKLETVYNRLHEIRTRFEVLKRDATIRYWEGVARGGDEKELRRTLEVECRALDEDFAFIAACNEGRESLSEEAIARLRRIGARTWARTVDDSAGLSVQELQRRQAGGPPSASGPETLLRDVPEHLVRGEDGRRMAPENPWGFVLDIPEYAFNLGELHNLSISKGTLTPEERFKINDHIVQTIIMLSSLPWPKHLRRVPDIAGGHHERPDGSGYPRRLTREQLSLESRIMAVADIFEALTAPDRPYRAPKRLSEALDIMKAMAERNHIDPDVFSLFLRSGACDTYAEKYLHPEQLDIQARNFMAYGT
ncbi:MAG: HD domain-containing protein [Candidatus Hydrogenedentes bacterium]|nr:HD domain-containing protein [Candidatus Hydrogenedentota bacterium]